VRTAAILRSKPGCKRQCKHVDGLFHPEERLGSLGYLNFFMPVSHVTQLIVWPKSHKLIERELELDRANKCNSTWCGEETGRLDWAIKNRILTGNGTLKGEYISVAPGELLIFLGHVVHAGAQWEAQDGVVNSRLHAYFIPNWETFPEEDVTYTLPPWIHTVCIEPDSER
jgi:hypothetical protein